jgi:SAM-dependent MidA family methyltransferase
LPTKKFLFKNNQWHEVMVSVDEDNTKIAENKINFKFVPSQPNNESVVKYLQPEKTFGEMGIKMKEGDTYEFSLERKNLVKYLEIKYMYEICYLLSTTKNAHSLIIDYGEEQSFSDSIRGIKNQKLFKGNDILNYSGQCDLSCYVNFKALIKVAHDYSSLKVGGLVPQGWFLEYLQIANRLKMLQETTTDMKKKKILERQYKKLVDENEMGNNFKVLYLHKINNKPVYPFLDEILNQ